MSTDTVYRCDGPTDALFEEHETCPVHASTDRSFLRVTEDSHVLHFCTWDCLLRYAATREPAEVLDA